MENASEDKERSSSLRFHYTAKGNVGLVFFFFAPNGALRSEVKLSAKTLKTYADPSSFSLFPEIDRGSHLIRIWGIDEGAVSLSLFERIGECAYRKLHDYCLDEQNPRIEKEDMLINQKQVVEKFSVAIVRE